MSMLLSKFAAVKVESTSLISESDRAVCESMESKYRAYIEFMSGAVEYVELYGVGYSGAEYDYDTPERFTKKLNEQIGKAKNHFIHDVCWHFQKTYNVTIDTNTIRDKYDHAVTYTQIVDEIIVQLDGLNFTDKALQEIKDSLRESTYNKWREQSYVSVKSSKVSIDDFLYFESSWGRNGGYYMRSDDKARNLCAALSHFETGSTEILNGFNWLYQRYDARTDWFETHEFDWLTKFQSIRMYKNNRLDLKFASPELAQQFAHEYLGV